MANVNFTCTVSRCTTQVDERALSAVGPLFLNDRWVAAVRAGTTTKCLPHYLDTDIPTVYKSYFAGAEPRRNRERS